MHVYIYIYPTISLSLSLGNQTGNFPRIFGDSLGFAYHTPLVSHLVTALKDQQGLGSAKSLRGPENDGLVQRWEVPQHLTSKLYSAYSVNVNVYINSA